MSIELLLLVRFTHEIHKVGANVLMVFVRFCLGVYMVARFILRSRGAEQNARGAASRWKAGGEGRETKGERRRT